MITLLEIYNKVAGQAWSKWDGEVESQDEFEENLLTSIQKALSYLWCSYPYPFRLRTKNIFLSKGTDYIKMPDGIIHKKNINGDEKYCIRIVGGDYLNYVSDYEILPSKVGTPTGFYINLEKIYFYPRPDKDYDLSIEYLKLTVGKNSEGKEIYQLKNADDYIDIPSKYEELFLNALITLSLCYAIAADGDENYSNYYHQFETALKMLMQSLKGVNLQKRISW